MKLINQILLAGFILLLVKTYADERQFEPIVMNGADYCSLSCY